MTTEFLIFSEAFFVFDNRDHFADIRNGMDRINLYKHNTLLFINDDVCSF